MEPFIEQLQDMGEVERLRFIQAHAEDTIEGYAHLYQFSEDEIADMREQYVDASIKLADIQVEFEEVKQDFKIRMTPHKEFSTTLLKKLTDRAERRKEDVYIIHDHDARKVYYLNAAGKVVFQKPLGRGEQGSLLNYQGGAGTSDDPARIAV